MSNKMKIKKGDQVVVTTGKDKGEKGKVLVVDRKTNRVIVEGINMITKHMKPQQGQPGGIVKKEAAIHVSNVMYLHKGKPTRIGYKIETIEKDGKTKNIKKRFAKSTGDIID
ncbi:MAG: 50S ribosomal protein L24 [Defluviitaleaceae bacterium]|nr:50S ribosomal protein L24 [Defluviitaleaceae bacterium]